MVPGMRAFDTALLHPVDRRLPTLSKNLEVATFRWIGNFAALVSCRLGSLRPGPGRKAHGPCRRCLCRWRGSFSAFGRWGTSPYLRPCQWPRIPRASRTCEQTDTFNPGAPEGRNGTQWGTYRSTAPAPKSSALAWTSLTVQRHSHVHSDNPQVEGPTFLNRSDTPLRLRDLFSRYKWASNMSAGLLARLLTRPRLSASSMISSTCMAVPRSFKMA